MDFFVTCDNSSKNLRPNKKYLDVMIGLKKVNDQSVTWTKCYSGRSDWIKMSQWTL
jgi:hypothetical protein